VLGPRAHQVVEVANPFGDGVGTWHGSTEEVDDVGSDHLAKEGFLVTEVRVEAFLAGMGGFCDAVDPGASQPVLGELGSRGREDFAAQLGGVSHSQIIHRRTGSFGMVVTSARTWHQPE